MSDTASNMRGSKFLRFRCTHCGNCCTDTIVPVTHHDLKRLSKGTGLKAERFCAFYKADDFDDGGEGLGWVELAEGRRVLGLKKQDKADACFFFKDERCSVYEHRPITCRVYPFQLDFNRQGQVTRMSINDAVECPYELDSSQKLAEILKNWNADDRQDDAYFRKVEAWNRRHKGGTAEEFLRFLGV